MKLKDVLEKTNGTLYHSHGWGYYIVLKSNWDADFGLSSNDVNKIGQDSIVIQLIKSNNHYSFKTHLIIWWIKLKRFLR